MQAGLAVACGQDLATAAAVAVVFKKNLNAAKPPEQSKGPFLTRKFFQEILGLEGSKKILGEFFSRKYYWFYMQRIS